MKCFYSGEVAIGTCKSCGRGLSVEFATEFPKGLACKNRCEKDVEDVIALIERNIRFSATTTSIIKGNARAIAVAGVFYMFMGVVFLYVGLFQMKIAFFALMGAGFILYAIYVPARAYRLRNTKQAPQT